MDPFTSQVTMILSILAVLGQIFILFSAISFVTSKETPKQIARWFRPEMWLVFAFVTAALSVFGTLYYSEIVGFVPCKFCWFQRIFMYPEFILLAIALFKKDFGIKIYSIVLALIGSCFALLHLYEQSSGSDLFSCAASGVSCSKVYFTSFGYITFPILALTSFLLIIVFVSFASLAHSQEEKREI